MYCEIMKYIKYYAVLDFKDILISDTVESVTMRTNNEKFLPLSLIVGHFMISSTVLPFLFF